MSTPRLIIFDLDGTLVDSSADLEQSVNHVRREFGLPPLGEAEIRGMIGDGAAMLVRRALGEALDLQAEEAGLGLFLGYYREHMLDATHLYPGALETLDALSDHTLAVLTNKPCGFSRLMLRGLGLLDRFSAVYGGDSFSEKKPHPMGIRRILAETDAAARDTWMVGDSAVDVLAGRRAGVGTCGVTWGYGAHTFREHPPDVRIDRFGDLVPMVSSGAGGDVAGGGPTCPT